MEFIYPPQSERVISNFDKIIQVTGTFSLSKKFKNKCCRHDKKYL